MEFQGKFIRKSTAFYLMQENMSISNDRLLRVRSEQPFHVFSVSTPGTGTNTSSCIKSEDLCIFRRVDDEDKYLCGRVIQFSHLSGFPFWR